MQRPHPRTDRGDPVVVGAGERGAGRSTVARVDAASTGASTCRTPPAAADPRDADQRRPRRRGGGPAARAAPTTGARERRPATARAPGRRPSRAREPARDGGHGQSVSGPPSTVAHPLDVAVAQQRVQRQAQRPFGVGVGDRACRRGPDARPLLGEPREGVQRSEVHAGADRLGASCFWTADRSAPRAAAPSSGGPRLPSGQLVGNHADARRSRSSSSAVAAVPAPAGGAWSPSKRASWARAMAASTSGRFALSPSPSDVVAARSGRRGCTAARRPAEPVQAERLCERSEVRVVGRERAALGRREVLGGVERVAAPGGALTGDHAPVVARPRARVRSVLDQGHAGGPAQIVDLARRAGSRRSARRSPHRGPGRLEGGRQCVGGQVERVGLDVERDGPQPSVVRRECGRHEGPGRHPDPRPAREPQLGAAISSAAVHDDIADDVLDPQVVGRAPPRGDGTPRRS